jgi:hypothetical protein
MSSKAEAPVNSERTAMTHVTIEQAKLEQALEALKAYKGFIEDAHILEGQWHWINGADKAITACEQALAAPPVQEPFGYLSQHTTPGPFEWQFSKTFAGVYPDTAKSIIAVYAAAQPAPVQEPVATVKAKRDGGGTFVHWTQLPVAGMKLYINPPAAPVPLTDEQREEIAKGWRGRNWTVGDIIDAIEAAHGIKEQP